MPRAWRCDCDCDCDWAAEGVVVIDPLAKVKPAPVVLDWAVAESSGEERLRPMTGDELDDDEDAAAGL